MDVGGVVYWVARGLGHYLRLRQYQSGTVYTLVPSSSSQLEFHVPMQSQLPDAALLALTLLVYCSLHCRPLFCRGGLAYVASENMSLCAACSAEFLASGATPNFVRL